MDMDRKGWLAIAAAAGTAVLIHAFLGETGPVTTMLRMFSAMSEWRQEDVRNWISSLSGWAALLAAWATVSRMNTQIREQRRQNDFIIGDMPPEIWIGTARTVFDEGFRPIVVVTITNMNRRNLYIRSIECIDEASIVLGCRTFRIDGEEEGPKITTLFPVRFVHREIPGRKVGSHAPVCQIECAIYIDGKLTDLSMNIDHWVSRDIRVRVCGNWNGAEGEPISLEQSVTILY